MEKATFAAGCFWGVQAYFDQVPGVLDSSAGYIGGQSAEPSYEAVCTGQTGHAEAVELYYDPTVIGYVGLLGHFFRLHDPTQMNRQGPDIGTQYRSEIFYHTPEQKAQAKEYIAILNESDARVVTQVTEATEFYEAEEYHQQYAEKTGRGGCHIPYQPLTDNSED